MQAHLIAKISEPECIGCTKCIQVCPVDAIIGSAKKMHTIIQADCTGCEACITACPVNCISLHPLEQPNINWIERAKQAEIHTQRRLDRLEEIKLKKIQERELATKHRNIKLEIQACVERKKAAFQHEQTKA